MASQQQNVIRCPSCGVENLPTAQSCAQCQVKLTTLEEGDATGGIIPYKNPPALIAYYLGLFSLFPVFGFFLGVPAVVLGILGLKKRREKPAVKGSVHAWIGIGCGSIMALIWGASLLLILGSLLRG